MYHPGLGRQVTDKDRILWVKNDEVLYHVWKKSRQGIDRFVRTHRREINRRMRGGGRIA